MKTKKSVEETFNECRKLCNHILKLSKVNHPELWKKFGRPRTLMLIDHNIEFHNDFFTLIWADKNGRELASNAFDYKCAYQSVKQFKEEKQKYIKRRKEFEIYRKTKT